MTETKPVEIPVSVIAPHGELGTGFIVHAEEPLPRQALFAGTLFSESEDGDPVFEPEVFGYTYTYTMITPEERVLFCYTLKKPGSALPDGLTLARTSAMYRGVVRGRYAL